MTRTFKITASFLILLLLPNLSVAQSSNTSITARGLILDNFSGKGVAYAQIACKSRAWGTNANEAGYFLLSQIKGADTLLISALGYKAMMMTKESFLSDTLFYLKPLPHLLREVAVSAKKTKFKSEEMGFYGPGFKIGLGRNTARILGAGMQVALLIENEERKRGVVQSVFFRFHPKQPNKEEKTESLLLARVRIFSVGEGQLPDRDLLLGNVIVPISIAANSIKMNIEQYNVEFPPEGVFIGLEFLNSTNNVAASPQSVSVVRAPIALITYEEENNLTYTNYRGRGWTRLGYGIGKSGKYQKINNANVRFGANILIEK